MQPEGDYAEPHNHGQSPSLKLSQALSLHQVTFDDVTQFDVVIFFNTDTAFVSGCHFLDVVFEAP